MKDNEVEIRVKDEGKGVIFDFSKYDADDLKTTGRGLVLVKELTDRFILHGNEVIAIKYLNK